MIFMDGLWRIFLFGQNRAQRTNKLQIQLVPNSTMNSLSALTPFCKSLKLQGLSQPFKQQHSKGSIPVHPIQSPKLPSRFNQPPFIDRPGFVPKGFEQDPQRFELSGQLRLLNPYQILGMELLAFLSESFI